MRYCNLKIDKKNKKNLYKNLALASHLPPASYARVLSKISSEQSEQLSFYPVLNPTTSLKNQPASPTPAGAQISSTNNLLLLNSTDELELDKSLVNGPDDELPKTADISTKHIVKHRLLGSYSGGVLDENGAEII